MLEGHPGTWENQTIRDITERYFSKTTVLNEEEILRASEQRTKSFIKGKTKIVIRRLIESLNDRRQYHLSLNDT